MFSMINRSWCHDGGLSGLSIFRTVRVFTWVLINDLSQKQARIDEIKNNLTHNGLIGVRLDFAIGLCVRMAQMKWRWEPKMKKMWIMYDFRRFSHWSANVKSYHVCYKIDQSTLCCIYNDDWPCMFRFDKVFYTSLLFVADYQFHNDLHQILVDTGIY